MSGERILMVKNVNFPSILPEQKCTNLINRKGDKNVSEQHEDKNFPELKSRKNPLVSG